MHPDINWFHGGRPVFGELVNENSADAPPRRQRAAAAKTCVQPNQSATVASLTDQEKEILSQIERENALAETAIRFGVFLARQMGIDPVVSLGDILREIMEECNEALAQSTISNETNSAVEHPLARRSERTIQPRKKGKSRKC